MYRHMRYNNLGRRYSLFWPYAGRLCPKGVPFSASGIYKGMDYKGSVSKGHLGDRKVAAVDR